jgi:PAS domain S-box-containing protein
MSQPSHRLQTVAASRSGIWKGHRLGLPLAACSLCFALATLIIAYFDLVAPSEQRSLATQGWAEPTREVRASTGSVMLSIDDAETEQRGFLLTGDPGYLEPYEQSVKRVWQQFSELQTLTADNPGQQSRLQVLHRQLEDKLAELATTIDLARGGDLKGALDVVRGGQGKVLMDAVRDTVAGMDAEEERLLQQRFPDNRVSLLGSRDVVRVLMLFGFGGTLIGGIATVWVIRAASARFTTATAERLWLLDMLDLAPVMMRDIDGTIRFWSEGCHRLFGWTAEQAVGRLAHELLRTTYPVPRDEINAALLRDGEWIGELRSHRQDGAELIVLARKVLGETVDGRGLGVMETVSDVSKLRAFEADLRASEARLSLLIENAPAAIAMFDRDMRYLAVSRRFLLDYALGEEATAMLIGRSHYEVFPDMLERWQAIHRRVLAGERLASEAEAFPRRDGRITWVRWEMVPWWQADGTIGGALLVSEDMTARIAAAAAMRENEARLRLVQHVGGIAYLDRLLAEDRATISEEFTRLFNLQPEQTSVTLAEAVAIVHPEDRDWFAATLRQTIPNGDKLAGEIRICPADGELRRISMQTEVFAGPDGQPYRVVAALRDITEMVTAREALAAQRDELERSNADLEEFAYAISHDLKAPLRGIGHLTQWIHEDISGTASPQTIDNLALLQGRVLRMQNLLDGLLEYSRVGRTDNTVEDVPISEMIGEIVALQAIEPAFEVSYDGGIAVLRTHRVGLQVVLHNLIGNAVKHHDRPKGRVMISSRMVDGGAEFRVSDDGPGIEERFHSRIFGLFQTLQSRDEREASGIGLAIVKRRVEAHGGRIWIESAPPVRGTTFVFTWQPASA